MANSFNAQKHERIAPARAPASRQVRADDCDDVDRASFDSFPASDPPSWNGVRLGSPCYACDSIENADDGR
jgi:hypothetical protein